MAHHHGMRHLAPRQRNREEDSGVKTVVEVVFQTRPKTFTGAAVWVTQAPKTLIEPMVATRTSSQEDEEEEVETPAPRASSTRKVATLIGTPAESEAKETRIAEETSIATASRKSVATTLILATSSPTFTGTLLLATGAAPSPSAQIDSQIVTATATPEAAASSGMSGGAKAGLAIGIILAIGALLGAVFFLYRRKKNQVAQQKEFDEKAAMREGPLPPPPAAGAAPSIRTNRTMSTAPRLSLRPVTQFSPTFGENRKSGGNLLNIAAATSPSNNKASPDTPRSPWERPGAANAAAPIVNPFSDPDSPQNSPPSPQNPFGNDASHSPTTPQSALPLTPHPMDDMANTVAANAAPMAMAAAPIARKEIARKEVPAPPTAQEILAPPSLNVDAAPPSPAWTEDIPASPGPAPSGPPPMAVAGGSAIGPAAAPNNVHRVQLDFKPSMQDELGLRAGQLVRMLHEYDDGWALCVRMDRSQQGVVPRTCLSKHPVKPRAGPPRQGPPGPRVRGPPMGSPMGPGGVPRPLTPSSGRMSPHPPSLAPANGRMSPAPGPRSMSPGPRQMSPRMGPVAGPARPNNNVPGPFPGPPRSPNMAPSPRGRSNSNAPYAGPPRSMSPGPYGGSPQQNLPPPPQMGRPRANSASQVMAKRASPPGPSPMNPNGGMVIPARKPVPGMAL